MMQRLQEELKASAGSHPFNEVSFFFPFHVSFYTEAPSSSADSINHMTDTLLQYRKPPVSWPAAYLFLPRG